MSPARLLSSGIIGLVTALLVVAPVPASADIATTTLNEAAMSLWAPKPAVERGQDKSDRRTKKAPTLAEVYAEFQDERTMRLRALGYFGDVGGLEHVLPVPAFSYHLTAGFGAFGAMWSSTHTGLDFAAPMGTSVVAVADGTVTDVSLHPAYGLLTVLTLEDGTEVWYAHQAESLVMPGQTVEIGHPIGTVGSSGNSTGPHLHLEVRPGGGGPSDPLVWLAERALVP